MIRRCSSPNSVPTLALTLVVAVLAGCSSAPPIGLMGAYRFDDGRVISIRQSLGNTLRYRAFETGQSRRLHADGEARYVSGPDFTAKSPVELTVEFDVDATGTATGLRWRHAGAPVESARRILTEEWITFESDGAALFGRLSLPPGPGPHPALVLVHGSGNDAATRFMYNGDFLAANGIAVLTFDKRGTGKSKGEYTFDFEQLAGDAVAGVAYLKTRPEIDPERIGLSGYSQGGWVAPLAASYSPDVRFVLVSYGMIESPAEEARLETRETMRKRGFEGADLDEVDELTNAAVAIVAADFRGGWEEFHSVRDKYEDEVWRGALSGTVIGQFVSYPRWLVKFLGPRRAPNGLDWYYDSDELLEALTIPMAWFLGTADESAPNALTIPKLRRMAAGGKPYELHLFDDADHGMLVFRLENGERVYTGYHPDYHRLEVEAALRLAGLGPPAALR